MKVRSLLETLMGADNFDTAMGTNNTAETDTTDTSASADIAMDTNSTTMYANDASVSVDEAFLNTL